MKRDLERIDIPGAVDAEERAARVVAAAFAERQPVPTRRRARRPLAVAAAAIAIVAAVLSPPGRAFVDDVRRAVGIEGAEPALFSLPAPGRLLVHADSGVWVARSDGSRRLLGAYEEASWSPFGRFVVAATGNELATLDPEGDVRWTLARPGVRLPRWGGTATDTRIAYLSGDRLRVVAGDGTGDAAAGERPPAEVAPAWRAGFGFVLAYADTSGLVDALLLAKGGQLWTSEAPGTPRSLEWSSDAEQLLVLSAGRISILDADSGRRLGGKAAADVVAAAYRPGTHAFAELHGGPGGSRITLGERTLFSSGGELRGLTWSPDGRWLLTGAPEADQWVFVRADGRGIVAVSNVSAQFHSQTFPRVEGWCCGDT